jgi:pimeloyl-ACP methyl ester carboxylesterase
LAEPTTSARPDPPATVVLVHGLWMHGVVFAFLRRWLAGRGFDVRCFSYPTVRNGLASNARALAAFLGAVDAARIHLVGHSLGGLVVLAMLEAQPDPRIGRVVLMGSPCRGSHSARVLAERWGLSFIVGRSIADWLARPAQAVRGEIGIIAGNRRLGLGRLLPGLPQPNDGVVSVAETRLAGAADNIVLPLGHSQMLVSRACAEQLAAFLRQGHFRHAAAPP